MSSKHFHGDSAEHGAPSSPAFRLGDHIALDFLNSVAAPNGSTIDWLVSGGDLLDWLVGAAVLDPARAQVLASTWRDKQLDKVCIEATELREWFRELVTKRKSLGPSAVQKVHTDRLNSLLARDAAYARIMKANAASGWRIEPSRHWTEPGQLLAPLAGAMADLLCNSDWDLVRRCEASSCTMWFVDRTKGHRRRWCSQAMCGNRAKVAAFRARQR